MYIFFSITVTDEDTGETFFEPGTLLEVGDDESAFFSGLLFGGGSETSGENNEDELTFIAGRMIKDQAGKQRFIPGQTINGEFIPGQTVRLNLFGNFLN